MDTARQFRAALPVLASVLFALVATAVAVGGLGAGAGAAAHPPTDAAMTPGGLAVAGASSGTVGAVATPGSRLAGQSGPDDARLTVTDVSVSPATPTVEDPITFAVTLRNSAGSRSAVAVDRVEVRDVTGDRERTVATATDLGTLSPADRLTVPVTGQFDVAGERELVVVVSGTDSKGNRTRVRRPVSLVVERAPPRLDVDVGAAVRGTPATVSVAVSNPTNVELRDVVLSVGGDDVAPVGGRRTVPDLAPGERVTVDLSVRPAAVGNGTVTVTAAYTSGSGVRATTSRTVSIRVVPPDRDVGVRVAPAGERQTRAGALGGVGNAVSGVLGGQTTNQDDEDDAVRRVEVTVTNFGNVPATDVVLTPRTGDRDLARRALPPLGPGASTSVVVDLSTLRRPDTVEFDVGFRAAGEFDTVTTAFDYRPPTGRVRLTGVALSLDDGVLSISGNAGNTGTAPVDGVVVAVGDSATVTPTYPRRNYFVGTVEGSEFAPFELTAEVDTENVSTVPVVVSYSVDGVTVNRTVELTYDDSVEDEDDGDRTPWLLYGGGIAAVLVVTVGAAAVWRRRG